jgi:hypothetical protein
MEVFAMAMSIARNEGLRRMAQPKPPLGVVNALHEFQRGKKNQCVVVWSHLDGWGLAEYVDYEFMAGDVEWLNEEDT